MLKQEFLLLTYNKDVVCLIDQGENPNCKTVPSPSRRSNNINKNLPSHDPYIPRPEAVFYKCSEIECTPFNFTSITEVASPKLNLISCFIYQANKYRCERIRYNHFKNVDKLLFLSNTIAAKTFYLVDCLIYSDKSRVCHKKTDSYSHIDLVNFGTITKPNSDNVLSKDEFLCEESDLNEIHCDINFFVPFDNGLEYKDVIKFEEVLLKTGNFVVPLKYNCIDTWCGFSGRMTSSRRSLQREKYEPPGGKVYRCYYANKQQICKELYGNERSVYNRSPWIRS